MKKEKMKYYVRKNIISFVIGLILFGSLGVYAIVTFQSKDVSYENKSSGLSSNNVQGAIDELYEECTKVPAPGDTILDSVDVVTSVNISNLKGNDSINLEKGITYAKERFVKKFKEDRQPEEYIDVLYSLKAEILSVKVNEAYKFGNQIFTFLT